MKNTITAAFALTSLAFAAVLPVSAHAMWWSGNPDLGFRIDRPAGGFVDGDVYVHKLRVHHCDGTHQDYTVNQWVDPVAGHDVQVQGGDLCSATWHWSSQIDINGSGWTVVAWPGSTTVNLEAIKPVEVLPYRYGGAAPQSHQAPLLHTTIE